jgi:hypothetical protein
VVKREIGSTEGKESAAESSFRAAPGESGTVGKMSFEEGGLIGTEER